MQKYRNNEIIKKRNRSLPKNFLTAHPLNPNIATKGVQLSYLVPPLFPLQ